MPGAAPQSEPASALFAVRYAEVRPAARAHVIEIPLWGSGSAMKRYLMATLLVGCLAASAQQAGAQQPAAAPSAPAPAPSAAAPSPTQRATSEAQIAPGKWDVDRARCSDLLGAADDDRAAAAMFYYGYLAAKAGIHVINVGQIDSNIKKVMDRCAAAPNITVPQAFRQALGRHR
jgi:hypothetical protein